MFAMVMGIELDVTAPRETASQRHAKPAWSISIPMGYWPKVVTTRSTVFVVEETDQWKSHMRIVDADAATGKIRWSRDYDWGIKPFGYLPVAAVVTPTPEGIAIVATDRVRSHLMEISGNDGEIRFQQDIPGLAQPSCLPWAEGFVFATDAPKPTVHTYSSRKRSVDDDLPTSIFPRQGTRVIALGNDVFLLKPPNTLIVPKIDDGEFGPPDRVWVLSSSKLLTVKQYGKRYWNDEGGDVTLMPHIPDGFEPRTRVASLFAAGANLNHPDDFQRRWTFQSASGDVSILPFPDITAVVEHGPDLWMQTNIGYNRFTLEPRILESHPGRLLMYVSQGGRLCSVDGGPIVSKSIRLAYVSVSLPAGEASRSTIQLSRLGGGEPMLIATDLGLFVLTAMPGAVELARLDYYRIWD